MPIKDKEKAREYFKNYMANRRKGLTIKPLEIVKLCSRCKCSKIVSANLFIFTSKIQQDQDEIKKQKRWENYKE